MRGYFLLSCPVFEQQSCSWGLRSRESQKAEKPGLTYLRNRKGTDTLSSHLPKGSSAEFQPGSWILRTNLYVYKRELENILSEEQ